MVPKIALLTFSLVFFVYGCGDDGRDGQVGSQGQQGVQGVQGAQGIQGPAGPISPTDIVGIIHPCPNIVQPWREVLLRLGDGTILASFSSNSNGEMTRFVILPPGTYQDTDDSGCIFTVNQDGTVS